VPEPVLVRLPLPVMAALVGGLALVVEVLGIEARLGVWSLALLALPAALAIVYLLEYRTLPYEPWHPPSAAPAAAPSEDEEEFIDPVEEADRLAQTGEGSGAPAATAGPAGPESDPEAP
jgi:hypothetical protein